MRKRTLSREVALQVLFSWDISKEPIMECRDKFLENAEEAYDEEILKFTDELLSGVEKRQSELDGIISKYATNWTLERMATIDRNILRMSCYELLFMPEVPPKVAINEGIELAKKYGDKDSSKFVNGILDKINKDKIDAASA